jgi:putative endonuclease
MTSSAFRRQRGRRGEALAARWLKAQGYVVERENVQFPVGELDLVAREGGTLCFVEVRSADAGALVEPLASVDARKQQRLIRAARWYVSRLRELPPEIRFDVVAVTWRPAGEPAFTLVRGAFDAE